MRDRAQLLVGLLLLASVVAAGLEVDRVVGARPFGVAAPPGVPSGAWFCPHGGGEAWDVRIGLANPGGEPVLARVRGIGEGRPGAPQDHLVPPGSTLVVPVPGEGRAASTVVEYFGGVLAAGWLALAGEDANGVAAEPCLPEAGTRWLLPDGSGLREYDDVVVVMNPLPAPAVVSLTVFSDGRDPVQTERWTNVTIGPYRARAFRLDAVALGETTASTLVEAEIGRIAVATLGISTTGGIRSVLGVPGDATEQVLPGAGDVGRSELAVVSTGEEPAGVSGEMLESEIRQPLAALAEAGPRPRAATTVPLTTGSPSTLLVRADRPGVAFARRTFGVVADQGSTAGAAEAGTAWVLVPSVIGQPSHPRIALANPGEVPASVVLSVLPVEGVAAPPPVTVRIPPGATVLAPKGFTAQAATSSVLAVAQVGTFVPVSASYALGREGWATYAVALGVRLPDGWVPAQAGV
jgi:hypothetical protein